MMAVTNRDDLAHLPLAEREYVEAVSDVLKNTLGDKLAGLYLFGSATSNAYQPGVSDIDIAAVITSTFPECTYLDLTSRLSHTALPCPARKLEFVLYTQESARNLETRQNSHFPFPYELNFNSSEGIKDYLDLANKGGGQSEHWFVLDIASGRYLGKALYGTDVKETFAEPDWTTVQRAISSGIWWYRRKVSQITRNEKLTPPPTVEEEKEIIDAVLNACRGWRWTETEVWGSKIEGAEWACEFNKTWPVIVKAMEVRRTGSGMIDGLEAAKFLHYVQGALPGPTHL
ncbi:hypothetical protein BKA65DRAFT_543268 [Rhexocercosporidium sp. MPI-PUGE-AT-0058]|nr:hypothetical protein BKA65DRAFT_543268 [Rhexocercosporidium sp. MPI-PUGE-AT-0058]